MYLLLSLRYFAEGTVDPIAVTAGIVQTGLYLDFFYVYFTKCVFLTCICILLLMTSEYYKDRSSSYQHNMDVVDGLVHLTRSK